MADLRPPGPDEGSSGPGAKQRPGTGGGPFGSREGGARDRAQLILITGFIVAVVLIALAVVMNSAIYTENLATRSESSGATDASAYQRAVEQGALEAFRYANQVNGTTNTSSYAGMERNVTQAVTAVSDIAARQQITRGHIPNVTVVSSTRGTRIYENGSDFTDENSNDDWTVAAGITEVRAFRMKVDQSSLEEPGDGAFRVVADFTAGGNWSLNITDSGTSATVGVSSGGTYETCSGTSGSFWVNVTEGTVAGEECDALDFETVVGNNHALQFENGSAATGEFSVVVPEEDGDLSGLAPNEQQILYATTLELVYRTPELDYRTKIEVAPGEADA